MKGKEVKVYSFLHQALVIALVLFVSKIIESFMPIPMPASVIGLVLLFILLCTGIVKLGEVESVGTALTNNIGFLFVPAGISVVNSLGVLSRSPFLIILLIIISTILLLICTGYVSQFMMLFTKSKTKSEKPAQSKRKTNMKGVHSHG
ncbi:antiholin-like murein hydrolase modulator LrgA [Staphylococcus massiliensis]|uniref:Murein hydrolase regulator LrgA n=1 Tax=Staphylococcus massiliensis S46 TaxID=1229783 RepID=K9AL79_9STAP|nr:antiholin-like murein hydrolase modulator LrgA [Staphylococcus massiliensis]EKU48128.1 murein hydrolase regulator LrgA [Staphylococcus massiliensis S46]MCG3399609.1 antiholin-like murein hydrolase modulator LrgA [Staphylococcus massiliensis]MCG3402120.1 antiholin-like murein hydrolase modulator LrgA [Staphylococcus massiliensis]MCG3413310.1 antiholin-like murein hydrolase modulator LrgA [Staphylococcus massiliensis]PNZ99004.1 murein hydrolase transporter LrgA [Staphylococcus massiliensis CC